MDTDTRAIRESYDRLAPEYARRIADELRQKPLDRQLLDRLAADIGSTGEICDMGCGPGHVARYLRNAGANVFGVDLSPKMLEEAQRLNPDISFRPGDMLALDLPSETVAGIAAFYAIVNIPERSLPTIFTEMQRVLRPGGLLLLAFHASREVLREEKLWDMPISMDFYFFDPAVIRQHLEHAGFTIEDVIEREPYAPDVEYQSHRAYIFARKPMSMALCGAQSDAQIAAVRDLFTEYARSSAFEPCFESFEKELVNLPGAYAQPNGRLLLVTSSGQPAGCVALRRMDESTGEVKRLYVRPEYRGRGFGEALARAIISAARDAGYARLRLETVEHLMQSAVALYRKLGFVQIPPYRRDPIDGVLYMELRLEQLPSRLGSPDPS